MKTTTLFLWFCLLAMSAGAQTGTITIDECYSLARKNYPLIKQQNLIELTSKYSIENASKLYLPQLVFSGFATYQSETIDFKEVLGNSTLPINFPTISKDQYKIQAEINQNIYDGGVSHNQKENARLNAEIQQQNLEVSLYAVNERINQMYFSILLMDEQLIQNELRADDFRNQIDKTTSDLVNGTASRSQVDELKAELSNTEQSSIEFREGRKAYIQMLSLLTGTNLDENTTFVMPVEKPIATEIVRPELHLYELRKKNYDLMEKQLRTDYLPKFSAFIDGAYGRPTLNFISNDFGYWYIGGVRLNWSLGSLYSLGNNRKKFSINRQNVDLDRDVFMLNTNITVAQENGDVSKYRKLIKQDDTTISFRASVKKSAQAQLEYGAITTHDFIAQENAENIARQTFILHRLQLLNALYNLKNTIGN